MLSYSGVKAFNHQTSYKFMKYDKISPANVENMRNVRNVIMQMRNRHTQCNKWRSAHRSTIN